LEAAGIEPACDGRQQHPIRPFLRLRRCGYRTVRSAAPRGSGSSFRTASGLSHRQRSLPAVLHHFCCRAVADRPRAPLLVTMSLHYLGVGLGGESEVAIGASLGAPINESEQLGSQMKSSVPTSKPIAPLSRSVQCTAHLFLCARVRSRSRAMSRSAMARRLSACLRPRATASSTFARPSLK